MTLRFRRSLTVAAAAALTALLPGAIASPAVAAEPVVACDGSGDIADVQAAVNSAGPGATIRLAGTCDFTGAPAHGASADAAGATAVLIRPGDPVAGLTITSTDPSSPATIVGGGTETAFTVAPGNDGITVRGLRFANLGRAVVALGSTGTTVADNTIVSSATGDAGILGLATEPSTVSYGAGGTPPVMIVPALLRDLTVTGNDISYSSPGLTTPTGAEPVAIDVRQRPGGVVEGVQISDNTVTMLGQVRTFGVAGVRVRSDDAVPATNAAADYRISQVQISGNAIGTASPEAPLQSGGRVGIVLLRVSDFAVTDNDVLARIDAGSGAELGGGIVAGDAGFGEISGNDVRVVAGLNTEASDLGAIGIVGGLARLLGDQALGQAATDVLVHDNTISQSQRGLVVTGARWSTVFDNTVAASTAAAAYVGAALEQGGRAAPKTVTNSVICRNQLDGSLDAAAAVSFSDGVPSSSANSFPGGTGSNRSCPITVQASPLIVQASDDLVVSGTAHAGRHVAVSVTDGTTTLAAAAAAAEPGGAYAVTFSTAELAAMQDGILTVHVASGSEPAVFHAAPQTVRRDADPTTGSGSVFIQDGDGYVNTVEILGGVPIAWNGPDGATTAKVSLSDGAGNVPKGCGPHTVAPDGGGKAGSSCFLSLPDGTVILRATWTLADGSVTPEATFSTIKDTAALAPTITSPTERQRIRTSTVTVAGAAEPGATVNVRRQPDRVILGTTVADNGGAWSLGLAMTDGEHRISADQIDAAENPSGSSAIRTFKVDTNPDDTTAPDAPDITSPADGATVAGSFPVTGTAEAGTTIRVFVDAVHVQTATTSNSGTWTARAFSKAGPHTLTATAVDADGNESAPSDPVDVTVDTSAPTVTLDAPANNTVFLPVQPIGAEGTAVDDHAVATVTVELLDTNGRRVGSPVVAVCTGCGTPSATWEAEVPKPAPGYYALRATASDQAGNRRNSAIVAIVTT